MMNTKPSMPILRNSGFQSIREAGVVSLAETSTRAQFSAILLAKLGRHWVITNRLPCSVGSLIRGRERRKDTTDIGRQRIDASWFGWVAE